MLAPVNKWMHLTMNAKRESYNLSVTNRGLRRSITCAFGASGLFGTHDDINVSFSNRGNIL